jgi:hypothetical protein
MAVPNTGQLKLYADIQNEIGGAQPNTSLHGMSIEAGFSTPDAMSEFYGYVAAEPPSVTSSPATSVSDTSMRANGSLTNPSGVTTQYGFYFGRSTNMTSNPFYNVGNSSSTSFSFNRGFGSLSGSTTYYYWAYASNDGGTGAGGRITQATLATISYNFTSAPSVGFSGVASFGLNDQQDQGSYYRFQYQHPYYGYSGLTGYTSEWFGNGFCCGDFTYSTSGAQTIARRNDGSSTSHRKYINCQIRTNRSAVPTQTWITANGGPYGGGSNTYTAASSCNAPYQGTAQGDYTGEAMGHASVFGTQCNLSLGGYNGYVDYRNTWPSSDIRLKTNITYL